MWKTKVLDQDTQLLLPKVWKGYAYGASVATLSLAELLAAEKKRKNYAFQRQFNEKPSILPGCPDASTT